MSGTDKTSRHAGAGYVYERLQDIRDDATAALAEMDATPADQRPHSVTLDQLIIELRTVAWRAERMMKYRNEAQDGVRFTVEQLKEAERQRDLVIEREGELSEAMGMLERALAAERERADGFAEAHFKLLEAVGHSSVRSDPWEPTVEALVKAAARYKWLRESPDAIKHTGVFYGGPTLDAKIDEARATAGKPRMEHVCGLQGYNPMIDPPCPACEESRVRWERR